MNADCFLDTNVLVYAAAGRETEETKRKLALELIENRDFCLSAQVLQEFYVVVTRKIERPMPAEQALEWIERLEAFPCLAVDNALVKVAVEISERHQISYWDGAIIAAAEGMGVHTLYSEDLNHGQRYGSVEVRDPFRAEST